MTDALAALSSVEKACQLLRVLSDHRNNRLTDIAGAAGLDKATALRLLGALARAGFVTRDPATKRYAIGRELLVLGASALARFDPRQAVRPSLLRLADRFEDTAVFSLQSGAESLCVDVAFGRYPIQVRNLEVGSRRPLGVGPTGLAMLATLPEAERQAVLAIVARNLERYPRLTRARLDAAVAETQARGYAMLLDAVVDHMGAIAVAILAPDGRLLGSLGVSALSDRIVSREQRIVEALRQEAAACAQLWLSAGGG